MLRVVSDPTARQVQISGPVDLSPHRIVFRAPRASVEAAAARNDVVIGADLVGGRLVLTGYDGRPFALDPATGRSLH